MGVLFNIQSIKTIFPVKVRTMKDLNAELDVPLTADEMILKVITDTPDSEADYILEVTGLAPSTLTKSVNSLLASLLITKELRSATKQQSGNSKRAYFSPVIQSC